MKKQLFSLVMLLAIIIFASGNVMAQLGADADENNSTTPYVMVAGSSHTFSLTLANSANTTAWTVWTDAATPVNVTASAAVVETSTPSTAGAVSSFEVDWARSAAGSYFIQHVETDVANGTDCATTTRRFYITIIDFDIYVYASDNVGAELLTTDLTACGEGTTANYGNESTGAAFSNTFNTNGDLIDYVGTDPRTNRYVSFQIIWRVGTTGATPPDVESITIDFETFLNKVGGAGTYATNTDLYSTNGNTATPGAADGSIVDMADGTGPISSGVGIIAGEIGTIEIIIDDRWSHSTAIEDLSLYLRATDINLYSLDDAGGTHLGLEPSTYENATPQIRTAQTASNNSANQIIQLAPATSTIGVTQN